MRWARASPSGATRTWSHTSLIPSAAESAGRSGQVVLELRGRLVAHWRLERAASGEAFELIRAGPCDDFPRVRRDPVLEAADGRGDERALLSAERATHALEPDVLGLLADVGHHHFRRALAFEIALVGVVDAGFRQLRLALGLVIGVLVPGTNSCGRLCLGAHGR